MKTLIIILNIWFGLWLGVAAVIQFVILRGGGHIYEPNTTIATVEIVIASIITAWFVFQVPYFIIKRRNSNE